MNVSVMVGVGVRDGVKVGVCATIVVGVGVIVDALILDISKDCPDLSVNTVLCVLREPCAL